MAPAPAPDNPRIPDWMKWSGLVSLGVGLGLLNVTTDAAGHVSAFEVCKHVLVSLGGTLTGGAVKMGR